MNWDDVLRLPAWTALSKINASVEHIFDNFYKTGEDIYLLTQAQHKDSAENDTPGPFITKAYWASSVAALKRAILGEPDTSRTALQASPPEQLVFGTLGSYFELSIQVPQNSIRPSERAEYSNKGAFLFKSLTIDRLEFCFFEHTNKPGEIVSVIGIRLPKDNKLERLVP